MPQGKEENEKISTKLRVASGFTFSSLLWLFLITISGYLSYKVMEPFLAALAWGIVLAIIFYPLYSFLLNHIRRRFLSASISILVILILIIGPFSYLLFLLIQESSHISRSLERNAIAEVFENSGLHAVLLKILSNFNVSEASFRESLAQSLSSWGKELASVLRGQVFRFLNGIVNFFFMIISTFSFLINGLEMLKSVGEYLPFSTAQKKQMAGEARAIITTTIYGGVVVGLVQGSVGGLTFFLLGISSPVFWGFAMFIFSLLPVMGTFVIWGPMSLFLIVTGPLWKGIVLLLIGAFVISSIDNLLRPVLMRGKVNMNFLLLFFSVVGGINFFGFVGLVMGPLVLGLFLSVIQALRFLEAGVNR